MGKRTLTKAMREWVLNRDGHRCCFHTYYEGRGLVRCPNTTSLEVHHVPPHRWREQTEGEVCEKPEKLITLCKTHHQRFIHPDIAEALRQYRFNRNSIKLVFVARDELVEKGIPYWVQRWDDFLKFWAQEATAIYQRKVPFPKHK